MSAATAAVKVPEALLRVYQHLLPENPKGIEFLYSSPFCKVLEVPANRVAMEFGVARENVIEELRRFLAIKAFTVDKDANKISPTPLSTQK
jgi:hypothetical protein